MNASLRCLALVLAMGLGAGQARADELLVFAAASTADAMQEAALAYQAQTGARVEFSFGASSELCRQIVAGAPADVFFSADEAQMEKAVKAGRVRPEDTVRLLSNTLVVVQSRGGPALERPEELSRLKTLALADPELVPAGVYAKRWLTGRGLWESLKPKVVPMLDVRAALAAAESGRADAAIVYATDARLAKSLRALPLAALPGAAPIVYVIAPLNRPNNLAARRWVEFLKGPAATAIFRSQGFVTP